MTIEVDYGLSVSFTLQRQSLSVPFGRKFLTVMTPSELHDVNDGG